MNDAPPPDSAEALHGLGLAAHRRGDARGAAELLARAAERDPRSAEIRSHLAEVLRAGGRTAEAEAAARAALERRPAFPAALNNLGLALQEQGRLAEAEEALNQAIVADPRYARARYNLGNVLRAQGRMTEAVTSLRAALELQPDYAQAWNALGVALMELGDLAEAGDCLRQSMQLAPRYPKPLVNYGSLLTRLGRAEEALGCCEQALRLQPDSVEALRGQAAALEALGRFEDAVQSLRRASRLDSGPGGQALTHLQLGSLYQARFQFDAAARAFESALAIEPAHERAWAGLVACRAQLCDWRQREAGIARVRAAAARCLARGEAPPLSPSQATLLGLSAAEQLSIARDAARRLAAQATLQRGREEVFEGVWKVARLAALEAPQSAPAPRPSFLSAAKNLVGGDESTPGSFAALQDDTTRVASPVRRPASHVASDFPDTLLEPPAGAAGSAPGRRLRLGYLSSDFRDNALAHLTRRLYGLHDRARFEVAGYSLGYDDGSEYRRGIAADCDRFVDLAAASPAEAARRIREDGIDLLVDLTGFAAGSRPAILALRPAPVQAVYLYPGTLGGAFTDYFLGDPVITPWAHQSFFGERLVLLPHCYQVNDHLQPIAARSFEREEQGLPPDAFVFCSFNNHWKIEPTIWDVWMRLLTRVPGGVLWLQDMAPPARENLRREAEARGVRADRLVFAPYLTKPEHLARCGLADLFLDTWICNAHTTASDALWSGVPVLTCPGDHLPARVAASLLHAAGLPELVAADLAAYEETAVRLAQDRAALAGLRDRVAAARTGSPLYDTPRQVRDLERAYLAMWARYEKGEPPAPIVVQDLPVET